MPRVPITIDADFPGGNVVVVDASDPTVVRLRPDQRTTAPEWFYWHFRIRGAAGQTVRFQFDRQSEIGNLGPCISFDGDSWQWLGAGQVDGASFTVTFPPHADDAFLATFLPYTKRHLDRFLAGQPAVERSVFATSEAGRPVELLTRRSDRGTWAVLLTARTHACETMGSHAMEGAIAFWDDREDRDAAFLREHVDLVAIPFIDTDGVEAGDQGKQRTPHDHNRDYGDNSIYAVSRALKARLDEWSPRLRLALDLHCPWIKGGRNDELFLVGSPEPWATHEVTFAALLAEAQRGELRYDPRHTIPAGFEWNSADNPTLARYVRLNSNVAFSCTFEVPYSVVGRQTVTADNVRAFGRDLGRAISQFHRLSH